jgi:hypothetical protein
MMHFHFNFLRPAKREAASRRIVRDPASTLHLLTPAHQSTLSSHNLRLYTSSFVLFKQEKQVQGTRVRRRVATGK